MKEKLLCMTVTHKDNKYKVIFYTHPYFEEENHLRRTIIGLQPIQERETENLLDLYDITLMWVGAVIAAMAEESKKNKNSEDCYIIYIDMHHNQPVIRMDRGYLTDYKNLKYYCSLNLPNLNEMNEKLQEKPYKEKFSNIIFNYIF